MRPLIALLVTLPLLASAEEADPEAACRAHLQKLGGAVRAYRLIHDGKDPAKLSDLYNESLVESLGDFACPASGTKIAAAADIDAKSDYTLQPLPGSKDMLVREKTARHPSGMLAGFADGSIKAVGAPTQSSAGAPPPETAASESAPAPPAGQTEQTAPAPSAEQSAGQTAPAAGSEAVPSQPADASTPPPQSDRPGGFVPVIGPNAFSQAGAEPAAPTPVPTSSNIILRKSRTIWIAGGASLLLVLWLALRGRRT